MYTLTPTNISGMFGEDIECGHLSCDELSTLRLYDVLQDSPNYIFQIRIRSKQASTPKLYIGGQTKDIPSTTSWGRPVIKIEHVVNNPKYIELAFPAGEYWFYNAQLETGVILSDWGASSEDSVHMMSKFEQRVDSFRMSITDLINDNKQAIAELNNNEFFVGFGDVKADLENLRDNFDKEQTKTGNWMRFDNDGNLIIGAKRTEGQVPYELRLSKNKISFMVGDVETASISNNELIIRYSTVMNDLRIGQFIWSTRGNGNLGLTWRKR